MSEVLFQFLRIEAHGASAAEDLLAEANRVPSHCTHIEHPIPARWLMGSPKEVTHEVASFMLQPQPFRSKSGEVLYRRTRCDQRCFVDCVASYPVETERVKRASDIEKQTLKDWLHKTHHFIQSQFGAHHIASCLHFDESHPHLHFYIVGNASRLHPGLRAEFCGRQRIKDGKERARRHRAGLKAFLDLYYSEVSSTFDHSRGDHRRSARRIPKRKDYKKWKELFEWSKEPIETELPSDSVVLHRPT